MINIKNTIGGLIGSALSLIGVGVSTDKLDHIVSIVCAVIGLLITITISVIIPLVKWWKKAHKDGKIDEEELDELSTILKDGKESIENKKKGE